MWLLGCFALIDCFVNVQHVKIVCLISTPLLNMIIIHVWNTCWSFSLLKITFSKWKCKNCPVRKWLQAMKVPQALELRMNLLEAHPPQARKTQYETEETQDVIRKTEWERRRCIFSGLTVTTAHICYREDSYKLICPSEEAIRSVRSCHLYWEKQHGKHKIIPIDRRTDWATWIFSGEHEAVLITILPPYCDFFY